MTKSTVARLSFVLVGLLALAIFAVQAWGSSTSTITSVASRPLADRAAEPAPTDTTDSADNTDNAAASTADEATEEASEGASLEDTASLDRRPDEVRGITTEAAAAQQADDGSVTMTLLHNNDGESKLLPNIEGGFPGIARFAATWVDLGRSTNADILVRVSSGDNFLASKEFAAGLARENLPLYDSIALRGLYEAMALGNHDFDFGPDVTARFIDGFRLNDESEPVPFVAANIDVSNEPALQALVEEGRIAPSTIYTDPTSELQVGIVGAITPRLPNISSPRNVIVDANIADAVNDEVESLISQGVDRIILVSHLQGLDEDRALIPQLSGVDIVVAGGGDELLKNAGDTCQPDEAAAGSYPLLVTDAEGNDVPVVTAPGGYRCIGQLNVTFDADGLLTEIDGASIGVPLDADPEEFALARVEAPLADALADLDAEIIGTSSLVLDGRRNSVRTGPSNVGELLADAILRAGQDAPDFGGPAAVVAVQNGGGIRNDSEIPAGQISEADTFDIAPFANFVVSGEISRERFKDMLEVGVSGLPAAEGTYPQIAGFTMEVDAARPARAVDSDGDCSVTGDAGSRVRSITLDDGTEIVRDGEVIPGEDIALATIDFLAGGGDCYPLDDIEFTKVGASYQQALSSFISNDLDGSISALDYPVGGSRTTISSEGAAADDAAAGDDEADDPADEEPVEADEAGSDDDAAADDSAAPDDDAASDDSGASEEELARTGLASPLLLVIALTIAGGGALVFWEAQRAGWLSLTNRLSATSAWIPGDKSNDTDNTDEH